MEGIGLSGMQGASASSSDNGVQRDGWLSQDDFTAANGGRTCGRDGF